MITRNTKQKYYTLEAVRALHHPTAQVIYSYVKEKCPTVSIATIYRVLSLLVKEGKINHIQIADGADCYDWKCTNHYHLICDICGTVCDIPETEINAFTNNQMCGDMFIRTHTTLFFGQCPQCYALMQKKLSEQKSIQHLNSSE